MDEHTGPVYEVTLSVHAEVADGFDQWLAEHVTDMLKLPGFVAADASVMDDSDGRVTRVVRYFLASDQDLENYLAGPAAAMRQQTSEQFGSHFEASRRILRSNAFSSLNSIAKPRCLNCGTALAGQYCGHCGQRAKSRLISVWELVKDAFGDLLDVDSRLWQTMVQLAFRPGRLTREYLQGRRARYMPPFRTYLVLSLLFFLVAFFDPKEEFSIFFEPVAESAQDSANEANEIENARQELLSELEAEGILIKPSTADDPEARLRVDVDGKELDADCNLQDYNPAEYGWFGQRLTRERAQQICRRFAAEDGEGIRGFLDKLLEYVPAGLFVLLPLMALVLKVLYPLSGRYYVEHLLLILHYHAFVFLALTVEIVIARFGNLIGVADTVQAILVTALAIYIPVYLYKTLRRVYEQGHLFTSFKFTLIVLAYWLGLATLLLVMAAFAAFTV